MFAISITDQATPLLQQLAVTLHQDRLYPVIGRAVGNLIRNHLHAQNAQRPNKSGWPRQNFYADAARSTNHQVDSDGVTVGINKRGIAQRVFGGTIVPRKAKYLTIPAIAEAYGKRAREFDNLQVVFGRGGKPVALAEAQATKLRRNRKTGQFSAGGQVGGRIFYWLVKSVHQDGDRSLIPDEGQITGAVRSTVQDMLQRIAARTPVILPSAFCLLPFLP